IVEALDIAAVSAYPGVGESVGRAFEAGPDLLCLGTSLRRDDEQMLREAHDALCAAVRAGRLDRRTLRDRAARTRGRLRSLRTRRRFVPAPALEDALGRIERLGAVAASRAVHARRARLEAWPALCVARRVRPRPASGGRSEQRVRAPAERGVETVEPGDPARAGTDAQLLALTRLPCSDPGEGRRLAELLARRPDAIVIHTGVPAAA